MVQTSKNVSVWQMLCGTVLWFWMRVKGEQVKKRDTNATDRMSWKASKRFSASKTGCSFHGEISLKSGNMVIFLKNSSLIQFTPDFSFHGNGMQNWIEQQKVKWCIEIIISSVRFLRKVLLPVHSSCYHLSNSTKTPRYDCISILSHDMCMPHCSPHWSGQTKARLHDGVVGNIVCRDAGHPLFSLYHSVRCLSMCKYCLLILGEECAWSAIHQARKAPS